MAISMDTTKVKVLGPAVAKWGAGESTMGHTTDDGFEFTYSAQYTDVKVDVYGETVTDKYLVSESVQMVFTLAQFDPEVLEQAIPFGTYSAAASPPLQVGTDAGRSGLAQADRLMVRPWQDDQASTETNQVVIYKALQTGDVVIPAKFGEQAKIPVMFMGLIDTSKDIGNNLFGVGVQ
jgi:hypothetical protein